MSIRKKGVVYRPSEDAGLIIALAILLFPLANAAEIEVLYIGDPFGSSPYFALTGEPGIRLTPIPAFVMANSYPKTWGSRLMRSYFPRSYEDLSAYDVIVLSDVRVDLLTSEELESLSGVVMDGGGLAMIGGLDSFVGVGEYSWHDSPVGSLLPVSGGSPQWQTARLSWSDPGDPFISSLPFDSIGERGTFSGYNLVEGKPGSRVVATLESQVGSSPLIAYWEVERGIGFAFASEWKGDSFASFCRTPEECHLRGTRWGNEFASWEYAPDFARNVVYLLAGKSFPEDPSGSHVFRSRTNEYDLGISLAILQLEVLDRLGVPTGEIQEIIESAKISFAEARNLYASGRLDESLSTIDQALATLSGTGSISSELEREHLLWMYIIQASAISSVALLSLLAFIQLRSGYLQERRGKSSQE